MKSRPAGRIRCGRCDRVLHDLYLRRRPRPHENREYKQARQDGNATLAALDHLEQHMTSKPLGATGQRHVDDDGVTWLLLHCSKCHIDFAVDEHGELLPRIKAARARHEDVILTKADRGDPRNRS